MNKPEYELVNQSVVEHPNKRLFFQHFVSDWLPELRISRQAGYLQKDMKDTSPFRGDRSTLEHEAVVALGCEIFGECLGLPQTQIDHLKQNAFVHDWNKKFDRMHLKHKKYEEDKFDELYLKLADRNNDGIIGLDPDLQRATGPDFLDILENENPGLLEKIIFYADDITKISNIALLKDRIEEARASIVNPRIHTMG
jgi:hypothetical protein